MTNLDQWWLLNWNGGVATARYTFSFAYSDDPSHTKIDISNAYMSCHNLVKDGGGNAASIVSIIALRKRL